MHRNSGRFSYGHMTSILTLRSTLLHLPLYGYGDLSQYYSSFRTIAPPSVIKEIFQHPSRTRLANAMPVCGKYSRVAG